MDALAAYGSDDDDDLSQSDVVSGGALSGLIAEQSSDEDDDQENSEKIQAAKEARKEEEGGTTNLSTSVHANRVQDQLEINDNTDAKIPCCRKRKRRWDNNPDASEVLPPPSLSGSSLVLWDKDFISTNYRNLSTKCTNVELQQKLNHLREKSKNTSWAEQLMSQQEFHNPHFFENAIEHFDIQDPLGSNISFGDNLQEFEFNVLATEEQTRIRQQQQQTFHGIP